MIERPKVQSRRLERDEQRRGMRWLRRFGGFRCCERASISIEAAIAVPLIIVVVSGIMQLAIVAFAYVNMQDTVRDVTREVSVRRVGTAASGYNNTGFYTGACSAALGEPTNTAQYLAC